MAAPPPPTSCNFSPLVALILLRAVPTTHPRLHTDGSINVLKSSKGKLERLLQTCIYNIKITWPIDRAQNTTWCSVRPCNLLILFLTNYQEMQVRTCFNSSKGKLQRLLQTCIESKWLSRLSTVENLVICNFLILSLTERKEIKVRASFNLYNLLVVTRHINRLILPLPKPEP